MSRRLAIIAGIAGAALLGGCADLMQQSYISQIAPAWFEAKAVEVKGEGYPELKDIPDARPVAGTQAEWEAKAVQLRTEADKLEAGAKAEGALPTDAEYRATAAQWRAIVEDGAAKAAADADAAAAKAAAAKGKPG